MLVSIFFYWPSGTFHIFVAAEADDEPRQVGRYDGAGSFGELALMYNMPRAATIQVRPPCSSMLQRVPVPSPLPLFILIVR